MEQNTQWPKADMFDNILGHGNIREYILGIGEEHLNKQYVHMPFHTIVLLMHGAILWIVAGC